MPTRLAQVITQLKRAQESGEEREEEEKNPLPEQLPPLFDTIAKRYKKFPKTAVLAALPCMGTLLSQLRAKYADGREQSPIFFTVIQAPQASGKSFAREMVDWLMAPVKANDALERQREQEWNEKKKLSKNKEDQPVDPKAVVRCLTATVSNAVLLKRADYAHELALFTFAEEIDTIVRGNKAGTWSQKNDIYRMAFDGAEWGQDYMSESSYSGLVHLHYNLLFLGTPLAVSKFFSRVEDGMASRFILASLPDNRGELLERPVALQPAEYARSLSMIEQAYREGSGKEIIDVQLPKVLNALDKWQMERIAEFDQQPDNYALDILRRRSAVIGFRAAMLAWWLCGRVETQVVTDFALWVTNEVLQQQLIAFGEKMNEVERRSYELQQNHEKKARQGRNQRLLLDLPSAFSYGDLVVARKRLGYAGDAHLVIHRWLKAGLIERSKVNPQSYTKTDSPPTPIIMKNEKLKIKN